MTDAELLSETIHTRVTRLMGNRFAISVVTNDKGWANECIDCAIGEIQRIEDLLTTFRPGSQANLINRNAGLSHVKVDMEVLQLIQRSVRLSKLTQGAFDITYGALDTGLWNFDPQMTTLPDPSVAKEMVKLIDYRKIIINTEEQTVFLKEKGMRIGFGGIGKGYAADRAKLVLQQKGIESGVVNAAGDLVTWGMQPGGQKWTIGVAHPAAAHTSFASLEITDLAVATSGNYEKYAVINGKKYSHTIDPRTGMPVSGIKSVTVISPVAEIADAMATPVMVMGVEVGLDMIRQVKGLSCIIVDDDDRIFTSSNIILK